MNDDFVAAARGFVEREGVRGAARLLGISPATAHRIAKGDTPDLATAKAFMDVVGVCACCGQKIKASKRILANRKIAELERQIEALRAAAKP